MSNPFPEIFNEIFNNQEKSCKYKLLANNKKLCTKKGLKEVSQYECLNCEERDDKI